MTYFNNINHQYNRVIFEFTDEEKQAAGFHKTSKEPAILEILRLLKRIYDNGNDKNMLRKFIDTETLGIPFNELHKSIEYEHKESGTKLGLLYRLIHRRTDESKDGE